MNNMFKFRIYKFPTCRLSNSMTTRSALRSEKSPFSSLRGRTHINFPERWSALQNTPSTSTSNCSPVSSLSCSPCSPCETTGRTAEIGTKTLLSRFSGFVVCPWRSTTTSLTVLKDAILIHCIRGFSYLLVTSAKIHLWGTFLEIPDTFSGSRKLLFSKYVLQY